MMNLKKKINNKISELGFDVIGYTQPIVDTKTKMEYREFLKKKFHGQMGWLENHYEKKINPKKVWSKVKSIVVIGLNYAPNFDNRSNYEGFMSLVFDGVINSILEITDGFDFGFLPEDLTEEDLLYVNPEEGASEYTYDEEEKILGRSSTNHPRVTFLNPEIYSSSEI